MIIISSNSSTIIIITVVVVVVVTINMLQVMNWLRIRKCLNHLHPHQDD